MRTNLCLFLLFSLFPVSWMMGQMVHGSDTLVGNEWIRYGNTYHRFSVSADGIYRISASALQDAGINLSIAPGSSVRLYAMGQQVPVWVSTDDVFGPADYIEFYGYKNRSEMDRHLFLRPDRDLLNPDHSLYSDDRYYYLTFSENEPANRINILVNDVTNPPAPVEYCRYEEKHVFSAEHFDPYFQTNSDNVSFSSYFHGEGFARGAENQTSVSFSTADVSPTGPDATLHIRLTCSNYQNHELYVYWNSQLIDTLYADYIEILDTAFTIPLDQIQATNQLEIINDEALSRFYLVHTSLTYPRLTSAADQDILHVASLPGSGDQYMVVTDFPHQMDQSVIYSKDGRYRMEAIENGLNQVHFVWPGTVDTDELVIADAGTQVSHIDTLEAMSFVDFSGDDTEYIVITHPELMEPGTSAAYIQYRSSPQGGAFRAKAYSILDLYDQFGYGIQKHPQAIRNFVEYVHRSWPSAKMIFIIGRGIEYNRSRYATGTWESSFFVPTFGRPGSDNLLAARNWDLVPRYPVGRLAVVDSGTIDMYLNKVKEYDAALNGDQTLDEKSWFKNVLHIAGGKEPQEQITFKAILNDLGDDLAVSDFGARVFHFQKESTDVIGVSQSRQMEKLLQDGCSIINYLGHSSTSTFEYGIPDPTQWRNKGHYPVFSGMGCSAGQIHNTIFSLSDRYVLIPDEGAIAFVSGSGAQFPGALNAWARPWYAYMGTLQYGGLLGESIRFALQGVSNYVDPNLDSSNSYRNLLEQQTLQGDPAIRLYAFAGPDYIIDRHSVSVSPALLNTKLDSFDLQFTIANIGRNLREDVTYAVALRADTGEEIPLTATTVLIDRFETVISIRLPLLINKTPGIYRLLIDLDPNNERAELPAPSAELNNHLEDNLGIEGIALLIVDNVVTPAYPADFAILNSQMVELVATSSNAFATGVDIIMELDTHALFDSPSLLRQTFPDHTGAVKWTPGITLVPDQEYFWRVSTDSISPEQGYLWRKRSFTYLPSKPNGWSQSHFHQLTDSGLDQIQEDSISRTFNYERKAKNFTMLNRFHNVPLGLVPYFFEDGKFNAKLAQTFRNSDVQGFVVAIDSATGRYLMNPPGGLHGSFNHLPIPMEGFAYNLNNPESRQNAINLIENVIPSGFYVYFYTYQHTGYETYSPETWAADEDAFGKSIFSVIENQYPGSAIRTLADKGSVPYIVLFQKDRQSIQEQIAADINDVISISFDGGGLVPSGEFTSVTVGPASAWGAIENEITSFNDTSGQMILSAWAMNEARTDTFWISTDITTPELDIQHVDAIQYPFIQLNLHTLDSATYKTSRIDYWRVLYEGYPEFILHTDLGFDFNRDTLFQGEQMSLRTFVENVSDLEIDSLPVSLRIVTENNQTLETRTVLHPVPPHSVMEINMSRTTADLEGDHQVILEINPERAITEQLYTNNIGILPMHILTDKTNPLLDVTFDGVHIRDQDIVAAKPLIRVQLLDQNTYLRLTDTSLFELFLQFPSGDDMVQIPFTTDWITFLPSPDTGRNVAMVELRPDLAEDGVYQFRAMAKDASGNRSGENDYFISFRVIHDQTVSTIYNFPNPFRTSTRFNYTLTGEGSPAAYHIQIVSAAGVLVDEITQEELGALVVGEHATSYEWGGVDFHGNLLPGGVYFYKMTVRNAQGVEYARSTFGHGNYVNDSWGKLVIVR